MTTKKIKDICKFYDKYGFFPDEKRKGIRKLNEYISDIKREIKGKTADSIYLQSKIKEYEKLKAKLKKEVKK